jgi:hypothetical protein
MDKRYVEKFILEHLKEYSKTGVDTICNALQKQLNDKKLESEQGQGAVKTTIHSFGTKKLPVEETMLVNEVIYDLIVERIITPGSGGRSSNGDGFSLPDITVTNTTKLNEKLSLFK